MSKHRTPARLWQMANGRWRSVALDTLRKGAGRLFGIILMGMLVFSFGIWGIADIFRGYGRQTLIRVGDTEINSQDYMRAQQDVLRANPSVVERARLFRGVNNDLAGLVCESLEQGPKDRSATMQLQGESQVFGANDIRDLPIRCE